MEVDQQTFAQKKPDQLVYLELGSGNGGMLLSISPEGFRFRAVSGIRPDGAFPFAFSLDGSHRLQGIGEIAWLESDGKSGGMRFVDVSDEFREALEKWLSTGSRHRDSGREVTPAAATPLDTMEKIREELRRGYPARPTDSRATTETAPEPPSPAQPPRRTAPVQTTSPSPPFNRVKPAGPADPQPPTVSARTNTPPRPQDLFKQPAAKVSDPPAKREEVSEKPAPSVLEGSAFLKIPRADVAPVAPANPVPSVATPSAATPTLHTFTLTDSGDIAPSSKPTPSQRPYIPAADTSYDSAWERAQLSVPQESPHLSRAAAGSIIGLALLVILGALAFNFRQDIGTLIIDVGQRISGQDRVTPATTASSPGATDTPPSPESQNVAANKEDSPSPSTASSSNPSTATNTVSPQLNPAVKPEANTVIKKPAKPRPDSASSAASSEPPPVASSAMVPKTVEQPPATIQPDSGSGQEEFNAARDILRGPSRQRDLSRAVELLWSAVRKGYVPAEVTLGDLYRRGDGVEKSCDQSQVLLVAASKKGSPDARRILEFMAEHGCE